MLCQPLTYVFLCQPPSPSPHHAERLNFAKTFGYYDLDLWQIDLWTKGIMLTKDEDHIPYFTWVVDGEAYLTIQ